jgi:hypothetical protein
MVIFSDSLGMTSYTLAILFLFLKPIVKELCIGDVSNLRIVGSIIGKISITGSCLEQT